MYKQQQRTNGNGDADAKADDVRSIDVRSDTVTLPTAAMRRAMAEAEMGDDVFGEDATVLRLQQRCAELFGKEAALFVPSGTMANLLAVLVHCQRRGAEVICGNQSHVFLYEQGGAAQFAGVQISTVPNKPDGTFCLREFRRLIRGDDIHEPSTELAIVENTHNICGGKVLPLDFIEEWSAVCREHGIRTHMDGARVFNAAEALGVPVSRVVRDVESVCFCLSKGLSAPVGSVLLGTQEFIKKAHRLRKALGGGMRQCGILAAAGLVALDEVVPTLGADHRRTRAIAEAIQAAQSQRIRVDLANLHTNILMIETDGRLGLRPDAFVRRLAEVREGEWSAVDGCLDAAGRPVVVKLGARDWSFVRLVVHHWIGDEEAELIGRKIVYAIGEWDRELAAAAEEEKTATK